MENKNIKKASVLAVGALALGSVNANATELFNAEDLGSAFEVRTNLIEQNSVISTNALEAAIELKCGEKSAKSTEHKCGEGKCGEKKKEAAKEKAKEHKCGEGKCGEKGKGEVKAKAKAKTKGKVKAKEQKESEVEGGGN